MIKLLCRSLTGKKGKLKSKYEKICIYTWWRQIYIHLFVFIFSYKRRNYVRVDTSGSVEFCKNVLFFKFYFNSYWLILESVTFDSLGEQSMC